MKAYSIYSLKALILFLFLSMSDLSMGQTQSPFPPVTKRILFLGNSITYSGQYINDLETYYLVSYPEQNYEWINVGLPSETASDLTDDDHGGVGFPRPWIHERIKRVMDATTPDVVFVCYGMNDALHPYLEEDRFSEYRQAMTQLDSILHSYKTSKIIYLTPTIRVDKEKGLNGYNLVLDVYSSWLLSQREKANWEVIDLHFPMKQYLEEQRLTDPQFVLATDGIHPKEFGHWLMARSILVGLGEKHLVNTPDLLSALRYVPKAKPVFELVTQRQAIMKDAWLTLTGHKRPRMKVGLPMPEARVKYDDLEKDIRNILNQEQTKK